MVSALPLDESQIARAAEDMIGEYGDGALTKADDWIKKLKSEGFNSVAETWEFVREVIKDVQQSEDRTRGYENGFRKVSFFRTEILTHNPKSKVMRRRQPYLLDGEKEAAQYWVVRGKTTDAHFHEALNENEEWIGPFVDYETARRVWAKRVGTQNIASEICYRIERIDTEAPPTCTD